MVKSLVTLVVLCASLSAQMVASTGASPQDGDNLVVPSAHSVNSGH